jgi:type IV secretory pathway VirJ component
MVTRLGTEMRNKVAEVILISPGHRADFTFQFGSWVGFTTRHSLPVLPEIEKLRGMKILCFYGSRDRHSLGPEIPPDLAEAVPLKMGHRVARKYEPIVKAIIAGAGREP